MSHTTPSEKDVTSAISTLRISTASPSTSTKSSIKPKNKKVADSWDDDVSDGSDTETETSPGVLSPITSSASSTSLQPIASATPPNPPPPTPASPTTTLFSFPETASYAYPSDSGTTRDRTQSGSGTSSPARRPEKTTAVAGRMIAGALGVRAPRRTEEEREYDRVMREKEKKRREEEKESKKREEVERERRLAAVWND